MTIIFFIAFVVALGYALWLRSRMTRSKAQFALAVIATMVSCAIAGLNFLSSLDLPFYVALAGFFIIGLVIRLIFLLSIKTIHDWHGPITVNVNELAKQNHDNSLLFLAHAELLRLFAEKPDPIANDAVVNWRQKPSEAPLMPSWHLLARSLFEAAFTEVLLTDTGWRDHSQVWVGEIYRLQSTVALYLFVFDKEPTEAILGDRIDTLARNGASLSNSMIFAVFDAGTADARRVVKLPSCAVEIWPRQALLRQGLRLNPYARELIKRFDKEPLGGTEATLKHTFVQAYVRKPGATDRRALSEVVADWLTDTSRRQLAVTGEYGQGKSTAMLELCVQWARRYIDNGAIGERVPLLIELRGKSPAESDTLAFLSAWAGRYDLPPKQLYNLIKAGEATIIFEGFDELRNAGRAYDRHEHFNALWRMAFPGTKLVFTGRPNFFLDEKEKNLTLRGGGMSDLSGARGDAFTEIWELDRLTENEISEAALGFGKSFRQSLMAAVNAHPTFLEIVSRPSMLPVVATIWPEIEALQADGHDLTSAILLEYYLEASYRRKTEELEMDRLTFGASEEASYLSLPRQVREVFTLAVIWKMACSDARNTIDRRSFDDVIRLTYADILKAFQTEGAPKEIAQHVRKFEEKFRHETEVEKIERVSNEIASAGIFVLDPAGGESNLRLPHKQFYEYLIAKVAWIILTDRKSLTSKVYVSVAPEMDPFARLIAEDVSMTFFTELIASSRSAFTSIFRKWILVFLLAMSLVLSTIWGILKRLVRYPEPALDRYLQDERRFVWDSEERCQQLSNVAFYVLCMVAIFQMWLSLPNGSDGVVFGMIVSLLAFSFWYVRRIKRIWYPRRVLMQMAGIGLISSSEVVQGQRLPLRALYKECLFALLMPSKSKMRRANVESKAQKKLRDLISPAV